VEKQQIVLTIVTPHQQFDSLTNHQKLDTQSHTEANPELIMSMARRWSQSSKCTVCCYPV